jgi:hypothetical protein
MLLIERIQRILSNTPKAEPSSVVAPAIIFSADEKDKEVLGENNPILTVDGKTVEGWHKSIRPGELSCTMEGASIHILSTEANAYEDLQTFLDTNKGAIEDIGEIPSLETSGQDHVEILLRPNRYYDVLVFKGNSLKGGRFSTTESAPPYPLTLDGTKLVALQDLGISIEKARGVKAEIIPMTAWGEGGRLIIVGFKLDEPEDGWDHTIMVDHAGGVSYSHGFPREDFRRFFKN